MNKAILLLSLAVLTACKDDITPTVVMTSSPDGLPFAFMQVDAPGVTDVAINIAWPTIWPRDASLNPAVPIVASQALLGSGTQKFSAQEIAIGFEEKNAYAQVYVTPDNIRGELSFPAEHQDAVIEVATDALKNPLYQDIWLERTKTNFSERLAAEENATHNLMWMAARKAILQDDPLAAYLSQDDKTAIQGISQQDALDWHKRSFTRTGAVVSVVGAISESDAGLVVDQLLGGLPEGDANIMTAAAALKTPSNFEPRRIFLHLPDAEKTTFGMLGPLPASAREGEEIDVMAAQFLARAEGPIFKAIREKLRASYAVPLGIVNYDRANRLFYIYSEVSSEKLPEAIKVTAQAYEDYRTDADFSGYSDFSAEFAKKVDTGPNDLTRTSRTMVESMLDHKDPNRALQIGKDLGTITSEEISARMLVDFPSQSELIIVAAGPDADAWPGACVITEIDAVKTCLTAQGF